jgi:hypothetical protein
MGGLAKLVARPLATARHSEFEFRPPSKIINGRHKQRSGQTNTLDVKKYTKCIKIDLDFFTTI